MYLENKCSENTDTLHLKYVDTIIKGVITTCSSKNTCILH